MIRLDARSIDEEDERKRTMEIIRCDASPAIGRRRRGVGADSVDDGSPQGSRLALLIRSWMAFHRKGGVWTRTTSRDSWIWMCVDV